MLNTRMIEKYYARQRRNRALVFSLIVHGIFIVVTAVWLLKPLVEEVEDVIAIDLVRPLPRRHVPKKPPVKVVEPTKSHTVAPLQSPAAAKRLPPSMSALPRVVETPRFEPPPASTVAQLAPSPEAILAPGAPDIDVARGSGEVVSDSGLGRRGDGKGAANRPGTGRGGGGTGKGLGNATQAGTGGQDPFGEGIPDIIGTYKDDIGDELGSVIDEEGGVVRGHIRLVRLKHDMSDWWQDPTAIPSLIKWLQEHVGTISADMDYAGGALSLTDNQIMEAPLVIMTGHDQTMSVSYKQIADRNNQTDGFSAAERAALRQYILEHNGMLFFDYCGDGGNDQSFASLVQNELRLIFPEYPLTTLDDMRHDIFQAYFKLKKTPVGGSTFWGTSYKGGNDKWRYLKGILVPGRFGKQRLGVVFCPLDYLCSMETAEVDSRAPLASRRSSDVYRFMTNMFVYQMRQRDK